MLIFDQPKESYGKMANAIEKISILRCTYLKQDGSNCQLAPEKKSCSIRSKMLSSGANALSFSISLFSLKKTEQTSIN